MNIVLLIDILWIVIVSGSLFYGRTALPAIPGGPLGLPIAWLLMVVLGIILIHLLIPGTAPYRPL